MSKLFFVALFCTLLAICIVPSANADTTYTYTGNPFTIVQCALALTDCVGNSIDGSFTLASPLGDNLDNVFVSPKSYSFEGDGVINNNFNVASGTSPTFEFSTNASGQIDGWAILVAGGPHSAAPFGEADVGIESFSNPSGILCLCFPFGSEDYIFESLDIEGSHLILAHRARGPYRARVCQSQQARLF